MAKSKVERIVSIEEQIQQLENQRKRLINEQKEQDRKDRTKRLCSRHGLFEKLLPDSINLTEEQFEAFLRRTVANDHGCRKLAELLGVKATDLQPVPAITKKDSTTTKKTTPTETTESNPAGGKNTNLSSIAS